MDIAYFFKGLVLGFSIAAPVGPIGILCIKRTLVSGRTVGVATGLGAATADALYGSISAFGLTLVSNFLVQQQTWLGLLGGLFLCYLGIKTFLSLPQHTPEASGQLSILNAYGSTLFLTLTNPLTILSFAAIFAGLGLFQGSRYSTAGIMVLGVFLGSTCWWLILSNLTNFLRQRVNLGVFQWINRASGFILLAFGIIANIRVLSSVI